MQIDFCPVKPERWVNLTAQVELNPAAVDSFCRSHGNEKQKPIKIPMVFFTVIEQMVIKFVWNHEVP